MKKDFISTSSYDLALMEMRKNPIYDLLTENQIDFFIKESLRIGKETAQKYIEKNKNIYQLLSENGISYRVNKEAKRSHDSFLLRGDIFYNKNKCEITVYDNSIQSIYLNKQGIFQKNLIIDKKKALEVHLSHEFFHFLEFNSGKTISEELGKVKVPFALFFNRTIDVIECSEIAAHAFSKQFCGLSVLPNYYDFHFSNKIF